MTPVPDILIAEVRFAMLVDRTMPVALIAERIAEDTHRTGIGVPTLRVDPTPGAAAFTIGNPDDVTVGDLIDDFTEAILQRVRLAWTTIPTRRGDA